MRNVIWIVALATVFGAGAASAQTAPDRTRDEAATTAAQTDAKTDPAAAQAARKDPNCLTQTGSRVQARGKSACAGYGRSYDRKDLERTGETDVGQALRKLDPRLR
ncbi:hypothetical protein J5226_22790 [Lysobacter sp. K5869]|uniref:hypothetical protein n=1 Tax=Lysobacter sp. K5869 TaxID=2820808 RepID=UPI001C05F865|nr:hypothetical protein [Lysobacter sp. K5869]QWP76378.1 hypothetical protein J5226_22790 [Lysobacter sp. K5869]